MDFCTEYPTLEPREQDRFREVLGRLMEGKIITAGTPLNPDPDWAYLERYHPLLSAYLTLGGWRLDYQPARQIARVIHPLGAGRVRFDRLESICLLLLRLNFHEQMGTLREGGDCTVTVAELREQLIHRGYKTHQVRRRVLERAVRSLARADLVTIEWGFQGDDRETITVNPVIESVVTPGDIDKVRDYLVRYERETARRAEVTAGIDEPDLSDADASDDSPLTKPLPEVVIEMSRNRADNGGTSRDSSAPNSIVP